MTKHGYLGGFASGMAMYICEALLHQAEDGEFDLRCKLSNLRSRVQGDVDTDALVGRGGWA